MTDMEIRPVRTLLVSDVHLGCKHSRAKEFLEFLQGFAPDKLYIVGDFIDTWKINSGWHWSTACDDTISHLLMLAERGAQVFYVPGNHDAFLRNPMFRMALPPEFRQLQIANEFVFETLRGWRFLVTHGDLFDCFETQAQWVSKGSSVFYDACLSVNWWAHRWMMNQSRNPYGACALLKYRVKRGIRFISQYESKIMHHARQQSCEGVVCGHIHTPGIRYSDSILYCNTGDWVENCTGLIEDHGGELRLVSRYSEEQVLSLPQLDKRANGCHSNASQRIQQHAGKKNFAA